ncbi:MAG TPA: ABC transporter ATP-binding protein [Victivallales bacterium]|nr:ABC transporter ATP-binding protein [Victivallales bacterium]
MDYITINHVYYKYCSAEDYAVKDISINISKGELLLITGGNGSGKSTLLKLIMKAVKPESGNINLEGKSLNSYSINEIGQKIGFVFQNPNHMIFNTTVYNEFAFGLKQIKKSSTEIDKLAEYYLKKFDLYHLSNSNPFNLSEGQKQLLIISAVLAMKPDFLILDEPTTGIDKNHKQILIEILNTIHSDGTGIIIISHDNKLINELNGREIFMQQGKIVETY